MCGSERQREREMCVHMGVCVSACAKECVCDEGRTLREMMMMMMMRERERDWRDKRESCNWLVYSGDVPLSQPEFQWHHTKSTSSCAAKHNKSSNFITTSISSWSNDSTVQSWSTKTGIWCLVQNIKQKQYASPENIKSIIFLFSPKNIKRHRIFRLTRISALYVTATTSLIWAPMPVLLLSLIHIWRCRRWP